MDGLTIHRKQNLGELSPATAECDLEPMDLSDKAAAAAAGGGGAGAPVDWPSSLALPPSLSSPASSPPHHFQSPASLGHHSQQENFSFGYDSAPHSPTGSESSQSRGDGDDSGSDVTSLCSGYVMDGVDGMPGGPMAVGMQGSAGSSGGSGLQNQVGTVRLRGIPIVSLMIDGKERLCLAQISNTLLKNFSYNEIHNRRVALGITCVQCTPVQLEILRRYGAMPISSRRCGMITKREAERLVTSFLEQHTPPKLPETFAFDVAHACGWGCRGSFVPARYNSSRAKCIRCAYCQLYLSPNKFIFHFHRTPTSRYHHPDAANFNSWRRHLVLDYAEPNEQLIHAWEDVKSMFNGGSRKRLASPMSNGANSSNKQSGASEHRAAASTTSHADEIRSAKRHKLTSGKDCGDVLQVGTSPLLTIPAKQVEPPSSAAAAPIQVVPPPSYYGAARGAPGLCLPAGYPYSQPFPLCGNSGVTPLSAPPPVVGPINSRQLLAAAAAAAAVGCGTAATSASALTAVGASSSVAPPPSCLLPPSAAAAAAAYYDAAVVKMQMMAAADLWKAVGGRAHPASLDMFWPRSLVSSGSIPSSFQQNGSGIGLGVATEYRQQQRQRHDAATGLPTRLAPRPLDDFVSKSIQVENSPSRSSSTTHSGLSPSVTARKPFSAFRLVGDSDSEFAGFAAEETDKEVKRAKMGEMGSDEGKQRSALELDGNGNRTCCLDMDAVQPVADVNGSNANQVDLSPRSQKNSKMEEPVFSPAVPWHWPRYISNLAVCQNTPNNFHE